MTATERATRRRRWQQRFVTAAVILFPMLVTAGLLAPDMVQVMGLADKEPVVPADLPQINIDMPALGNRPLLVPRDFSAGFVPELLDLDQLFLDTQSPSGEQARQFARLLTFPRHHGDVIVLDDVDGYMDGIVFKDVLAATIVGVENPDDSGGPLALVDPLPAGAGNGVRFDDFTGEELPSVPGSAVPEPGSGPLVGFGLVVLIAARRFR